MKADKEEFFNHYWVEDRHQYFKKLPKKEARHLLQKFDDTEIESNVNSRKFQEAYICDYIEDIWNISKRSFWKHIELSLTHDDGIVLSDNNNHIEIMKAHKMPIKVFQNLLIVIPSTIDGYFFEVHLDILFSQLCNFISKRRIALFNQWFSVQSFDVKKAIMEYAKEHVSDEFSKKIFKFL